MYISLVSSFHPKLYCATHRKEVVVTVAEGEGVALSNIEDMDTQFAVVPCCKKVDESKVVLRKRFRMNPGYTE